MNTPQNVSQFLAETHACAMQMMQNAAIIQKELPGLDMPDDLRTSIGSLCDELIGTKHDLMHAFLEAAESLESEPERFDRWKERIRPRILHVMMSITECVEAVEVAVKNGSASQSVSFLVMESAANILNTAPALPTVSEDEEDESAPDGIDDDDDEDGDGYDPDCYAFYSEDSYPVGQLIDAIRLLTNRPDLPTETTENIKVFLFAMERLPLMTPGILMSLALRLDQGGESDWIEIRMEDDIFTLSRGTWIDGDADTEAVFEVGSDYRDGDAFQASNFAQSFLSCAEDVCREVITEDFSDEPFTGWDLEPDKSRWASLQCSFI
ncbi:MAG: hypothetical protein Q7R22_000400 [Verrucomicrobiota bacterium JB025]|nr:hypothetical protein [Verrucomicrobiota bacterium JB025]